MTTSGISTLYTIPNNRSIVKIISGSDGVLWFTSDDSIGRITTSGVMTWYELPDEIPPFGTSPISVGATYITLGSDGAIWFTEDHAHKIGRITTSGEISEFSFNDPDFSQHPYSLRNIATGSDGNIWFLGEGSNDPNLGAKLFKMTATGQTTEYTVPSTVGVWATTEDMISGSDGALWLTLNTNPLDNPDITNDELVRVTTDGEFTNYPISEPDSPIQLYELRGITTGPDNNLWVAEPYLAADGSVQGKIRQIVLSPSDTTPPTIGAPTWSANPLLQGQNTTLSIPASDTGSGLASVKYAVNGAAGADMTYDASTDTWKDTFGSSLAAGTYNIAVTATDHAGNTSVANDVLAVYAPANGYVTGHAKTLPTTSDILPIARDTSSNPAKLIVGFTNVTAPTAGSFDVDYTVKNKKDAFSISSTSINWVVVQDSTHASILGHGDLTTYVNGAKTVTSNVSMRFDIVLGTNGAADHITVKIYNPGVDPNMGTPSYSVSDDVLANGSNLMIHP